MLLLLLLLLLMMMMTMITCMVVCGCMRHQLTQPATLQPGRQTRYSLAASHATAGRQPRWPRVSRHATILPTLLPLPCGPHPLRPLSARSVPLSARSVPLSARSATQCHSVPGPCRGAPLQPPHILCYCHLPHLGHPVPGPCRGAPLQPPHTPCYCLT